jgi:hypothetical protein
MPYLRQTDAARHAPVDLKQGLCRYGLKGEGWDMTLSVPHGS